MKERYRSSLPAIAPPRSSVDAAAESPRRGGLPVPLSERKLLLYVMDASAIALSLSGVLYWRLGFPLGWETVSRRPIWFALLALLLAIIGPLLNAYDLRKAARMGTGVSIGALTACVVSLVYLAIPYVTPPLLTSRLTAGLFVLGAVVLSGTFRLGYTAMLVQPRFRQRAVIVGGGWAGRTLADAIRSHASTEYDLVGFVDDDPTKQMATISDLAVLGTRHDLLNIVRARRISEVIVAITHYDTMNGELAQALMDCHEQGVRVSAMSMLYERLTGKVPVEHATRSLNVVLPLDREPSLAYLAAKRTIDIFIGVAGVSIFVLLFPMVALAIKGESRGPVFYHQVRLGRGGRPFSLLKFRTMGADAEAEGPQWARERDERVTLVGRVLRSLHLDELPQSINLLRGEMSFVGPRPERPEFVANLERGIPFYRARHAVRPGITGWAQVNFRYGASVQDALEKLQYDLYYIKHQSFWLDLVIMIKTVALIMSLRGR